MDKENGQPALTEQRALELREGGWLPGQAQTYTLPDGRVVTYVKGER